MVAELPAGTVTFVFTDIEGSTRLLRRLGDDYADALERHRVVLRDAWRASGGTEVSTDGDACFVAFGSADAAIIGCDQAQRALRRESWPGGAELRVRCGIHTGIAFPRDGDYVALAVHQAARVVNAAHGGQILASQDTVDALSADPPGGIVLTNLGRYRLRDFDGPVALFQVGGDGPAAPSARAVPADQHNLATAPTSFVGRSRDVARLTELIQGRRVVTIVGMGGVGKTRLATELGVSVAPEWTDGVWMVDLSTISDPALVVVAAAAALGTPPTELDRRAEVLDHLTGLRAVLILDNCEHLLDACATFLIDVLKRCPSVAVLATSREPLGVAGELIYRLAPLQVIDDATRLFLDRMGEDTGAPPDHEVVARICERCDGMPLAIELAASRCRVMSVAEILAGLDERFRLLRSSERGAPERQRTMTALLDWSYELLSPQERSALERLSVFIGTFDLQSASAAVAHDRIDPYDVPELVWSLAEKSLLMVEPAANATRYRMLETVRAYSGERLSASDDPTSPTVALAAWFVDQFPLADRGDRSWLSRLATEVDTMTGLISSLAPDDPSLPLLARIRGELRAVSGETKLGWEEADDVLARVPAPTPSTVRLEFFAASLVGDAGRIPEALRRCDHADLLLDEVGDTDRWGSVSARSPRTRLLLRTGRPELIAEAETMAEALVTTATTEHERADALLQLGLVKGTLDREGVAELYDEVAAIARRNRDHVLLTLALNNLAETDLRSGLIGQAARHQREALTYAAELGMEHIVSFGLIAAARIAEAMGSYAIAVGLYAAAEQRLEATGIRQFPDDQALCDAMLARAAATLGAIAFDDAQLSGRLLTAERALADASAVFATAAGTIVAHPSP
jgi:predicted ATPase/class 3 adenylate cyclase